MGWGALPRALPWAISYCAVGAEEVPCAREGNPQAAPWEAAHASCAKGARSPVIVLAGLLFTLRAELERFSCPERIRKVNKYKAKTINLRKAAPPGFIE